ncbi:MAG TPA: hypothetical protein ENJ82_07300 [Bacteroidetes bacterium]|nr:hypothetical protein [Bacteroidota bacterium]
MYYPQTKTFEFDYQGAKLSVNLSLEAQVDQQYELAPHSFSYSGTLPKNWRESYYAMYLSHASDQVAIGELLDQLQALQPGASRDERAEMAVAFVQGAITYDWDTFHNIDQGRIRYPYETLWDGTGVCADKSILLAKLLTNLGYGVVFFTYERANHMALGIQAPAGFGSYRTAYAFVESTSYTPIGRIPDTYIGGIRLERNPLVVAAKGAGRAIFEKISSNQEAEKQLEGQFGKDFLMMRPEQQTLRKQMVVMEAELEEMKKQMRGCRGTLAPEKFRVCQELQEKHNRQVQAYNQLVADFNGLSA